MLEGDVLSKGRVFVVCGTNFQPRSKTVKMLVPVQEERDLFHFSFKGGGGDHRTRATRPWILMMGGSDASIIWTR